MLSGVRRKSVSSIVFACASLRFLLLIFNKSYYSIIRLMIFVQNVGIVSEDVNFLSTRAIEKKQWYPPRLLVLILWFRIVSRVTFSSCIFINDIEVSKDEAACNRIALVQSCVSYIIIVTRSVDHKSRSRCRIISVKIETCDTCVDLTS